MSRSIPGLAYREFDGRRALATQGEPVYGERTSNGWREWPRHRSKLAGMLERDMGVDLGPTSRVLYLGAAAGTTVSHLADLVEVVYALEFAPRPMADLLEVASKRPNVIPLLKDARQPETYAHVVEQDVDLLVQDVATRDQAGVAVANQMFLAGDGQLALAVKARSEDVAASPESTFDRVRTSLESAYVIEDEASLEPVHHDHLAVLARPRTD